jgi:3-methyladenine DNA glycosylase/8-oxoguanine DNA glycosylase
VKKRGFAFDPAVALAHLRKSDPILAELIERVGPFALELRPVRGLFKALLRSITYQQLHGRAAEAIHRRVVAELKKRGGVKPAVLLRTPEATLRAAGLSANKLRAMRDLAAKCLDGTVPSLAQAHRLSDEELIARLTQVRGIGPWTVHMLLIFYLGRGDILPTGDYAIRLAFRKLYRKRKDPTVKALLRQTRHWQPYRSIASWYLWRSLDQVL